MGHHITDEETAQKKQSPALPTCRGLNPSSRNWKFKNMLEPSDNVVCVLKFCWGPGFNSISPEVKSFILDIKFQFAFL